MRCESLSHRVLTTYLVNYLHSWCYASRPHAIDSSIALLVPGKKGAMRAPADHPGHDNLRFKHLHMKPDFGCLK